MTDEFTKKTVKKFGARGSPVFEQEQKTTDLDELEERVEQTTVPFCECGHPILTESGDVFRCTNCELLCCTTCHIEVSKRVLCPTCSRRLYGIGKRTYLSLIFLDHDLMAPDDLVQVTTQAGEVIELTIDTAADVLVEHDYLTDDGRLSPEGKEALAVGHQLYRDDGDIQRVMEQIRLQEVITRE